MTQLFHRMAFQLSYGLSNLFFKGKIKKETKRRSICLAVHFQTKKTRSSLLVNSPYSYRMVRGYFINNGINRSFCYKLMGYLNKTLLSKIFGSHNFDLGRVIFNFMTQILVDWKFWKYVFIWCLTGNRWEFLKLRYSK